MKTIYLVRYNESSPGVKVITDAFTRVLHDRNYKVVVTRVFPERLNDADILITYGPKEAYDAVKRKLPVRLALLVDNYSLGQLNKAKFFLKRGKICYKDFWYSLVTGLLYRKRENTIARHIKHLMFVSQTDIDHFKRRNPDNTYYLVPNGVNIPNTAETEKTKSDTLRLGVLSNWTDATVQECQWFIEDILPRLNAKDKVRLVVAGKGASPKSIAYFNRSPYIEYLGPVASLSDFFRNIDIYVATVPRGCGILNKVLDAFAYRTLVIGIQESFSGFSSMEKSYIVCRSLEDFQHAIEVVADGQIAAEYVQNASNYIEQHNNWDKNYTAFTNRLQSERII